MFRVPHHTKINCWIWKGGRQPLQDLSYEKIYLRTKNYTPPSVINKQPTTVLLRKDTQNWNLKSIILVNPWRRFLLPFLYLLGCVLWPPIPPFWTPPPHLQFYYYRHKGPSLLYVVLGKSFTLLFNSVGIMRCQMQYSF